MATTAVYPSTKICKDCQQELPLESFHKHERTKDGKHIYCKACVSLRYKRWREQPGNRERSNANWARFNAKSRGFAGFLREHTPCQLCGERKASLLDFHHLDPATKVDKVSQITGLREIINEAQKCAILCKECHKGIHHGGVDGTHLQPLSFEYIDGRFTEYARDFTMKNG